MSRVRARSTLFTLAVAVVVSFLGSWLLARSTLIDRMLGQPDAWAILPVLFMALRLFVIVGAPPLAVMALGSLLWSPPDETGGRASASLSPQSDADRP